MTQWKETVNCNTVAFCQDLIYLILHQSVLCSKYHTVTWWITHTHAHTHTHKFLVHHQQKIRRYLSFKTKNTSYTYGNINISCSTNSYGYSGVLQVESSGTWPRSGSQWRARGFFSPPPTPGCSQKKWKRLMYAWLRYMGSRQGML